MLTISTYTLATLVIVILCEESKDDKEKLSDRVWFAEAPRVYSKLGDSGVPTFEGLSTDNANDLKEFFWFSDDKPIPRFKTSAIPRVFRTTSRPDHSKMKISIFSELSPFSDFRMHNKYRINLKPVLPTATSKVKETIHDQPYFSLFSAYSNLPIHYNYGLPK